MKKFIILATLIASVAAMGVMAKEPKASITQKRLTIAAGVATNTVKTVKLDTGNDPAVIDITGAPVQLGVGLVRAVTFSIDAPVTNGSVAFYTYDQGVKSSSAIYSVSAITGTTYSVRHDFTNDIYSGTLWMDFSRGAGVTNTTATVNWATIVE